MKHFGFNPPQKKKQFIYSLLRNHLIGGLFCQFKNMRRKFLDHPKLIQIGKNMFQTVHSVQSLDFSATFLAELYHSVSFCMVSTHINTTFCVMRLAGCLFFFFSCLVFLTSGSSVSDRNYRHLGLCLMVPLTAFHQII